VIAYQSRASSQRHRVIATSWARSKSRVKGTTLAPPESHLYNPLWIRKEHQISRFTQKIKTFISNKKSLNEKCLLFQPPSDQSTSPSELTEFSASPLNILSHCLRHKKARRNLPDLANELSSANFNSSSSKLPLRSASISSDKNDTTSQASSDLKSTLSKFGSRTDESDFEKLRQIRKLTLLAAFPILSKNIFCFLFMFKKL